MPLNDFNFNPSEGLRNVTQFPSKPGSGTEAREQIQGRLDEVKDYLNNEVKTEIETHLADDMPHQFTDGTKTYKWGLKVINGVVNMIYEEV